MEPRMSCQSADASSSASLGLGVSACGVQASNSEPDTELATSSATNSQASGSLGARRSARFYAAGLFARPTGVRTRNSDRGLGLRAPETRRQRNPLCLALLRAPTVFARVCNELFLLVVEVRSNCETWTELQSQSTYFSFQIPSTGSDRRAKFRLQALPCQMEGRCAPAQPLRLRRKLLLPFRSTNEICR